MGKVAVQLIFGRNDEPFLEYAIRSVSWADYFTVCNTAPGTEYGDANEQVIRRLVPEEKLHVGRLEPDERGHFSFAEARNICLRTTEIDDYVLIVDSDDVHYPEFEEIVRSVIEGGVDSLTVSFYHLMVYKNLYQFVQPREILFKNYEGTQFVKPVHEVLVNKKTWPMMIDYKYMHYGYVKSQQQVFNRWKFYSDLEGDYTHYDGQDPEHIIDDRISVSELVTIAHPEVIQEFLEEYPTYDPLAHKGVSTYWTPEKVGLILLTKNDEEWLDNCLSTLYNTPQNPLWELLVIDIASTDESISKLLTWSNNGLQMEIVQSTEDTSLSEALNFGFNTYRVRKDIDYIGWIHPDMEFSQNDWLLELWKALYKYPKIGKICASNPRDTIPTSIIPGHEQCYIIRKDIVNKIGLFDEDYIGIGGYEDWDYNRRILMHEDYKVCIAPNSHVMHHGMGTRSKRDTTTEQIANAAHYHDKWKTNEPAV